ncbi:MAG: rhomboid family intramembrane serine protease [Deltaproteobacteria bacterium]|nr:rhomboid family intramembrane serine protease [Deltaproteobacteria bacterium]
MALGGFNCPWCRYYNAADAGRCGRCERWLPPPLVASLVRQIREVDLLATKTLAGLCVIVFVLEMATNGGGDLPILTGMRASTLIRFGALLGPSVGGDELAWSEPWRLLASCFVHMGVLHIAMNLFALVDLGRLLERDNGPQRFVIAFVVTGILGFVASTFWYQWTGSPYVTAGASGAVFGLDGVLLGQMLLRRDPRWKSMLVRTLVYSFVFYFAMGTNQAAHIGGLAAGFLLGVAFQLESRPWKIAAITVPLTAVSLLASVASVGISAFGPLWREVRAMEEQREILRDLMMDEQTRAIRGETSRPVVDASEPSGDPPPTDGESVPSVTNVEADGAAPEPEPPGQTDETDGSTPSVVDGSSAQ